jgi:hypothetical protein
MKNYQVRLVTKGTAQAAYRLCPRGEQLDDAQIPAELTKQESQAGYNDDCRDVPFLD